MARGGLDFHAFVLPGVKIVRALVDVEPGKHAVQILGIAVILNQNGPGVGVGDHVFSEVLVIRQDVVDDPAEEGNVGAGAQWDVNVGQRAGPGETWVDVNNFRPAGLGLHHPLKSHRVAFGHVRTLDHDAIRVL